MTESSGKQLLDALSIGMYSEYYLSSIVKCSDIQNENYFGLRWFFYTIHVYTPVREES